MLQHNAITLKQLRALASVRQSGSITAAAEALNLTAPAVSTQLKQLEQNIGAKLLNRGVDGNGALTPQGQEVLKTVSRIESALTRCYRTIDSMNAGKSGLVSLGVVSTGKYFAPALVAKAKVTMPDIRIDLLIDNRQRIVAALEDHEIDLAIMGRPPRYPVVESALIGPHPHVLVAAPDHPLVTGRDILPEAIFDETFILREQGSGTRILTERFLDRVGHGQTYDYISFTTNETIKQAVIAGLGIALLSVHTVQDAINAGQLGTIDLHGLPIMRQWFLVRPAGAPETPAAQKVRALLLDRHGDFLPRVPD